MQLMLKRLFISEHIVGGVITIQGRKVCHTSEHRTAKLLPPGEYSVQLLYQRAPYARRMPCILRICQGKVPLGVIQWGNGVHSLTDGSIIVGQRVCRDLVIHSRRFFNRLYDRLKKCQEREEDITLLIVGS